MGEIKELNINGNDTNNEQEIENHIASFYGQLYNQHRPKADSDQIENLLRNMPKISQEEKLKALQKITIQDLEQTLKLCSDSAPGPDGIPYSYLKATWPTFGPKLLASWEKAMATNSLTQSHNYSYLKLLPKAGKNLKDIKNWRPITLSNCDHKLITKTLSNLELRVNP